MHLIVTIMRFERLRRWGSSRISSSDQSDVSRIDSDVAAHAAHGDADIGFF